MNVHSTVHAGRSFADLLEAYPHLTEDDLRAALAFAADYMQHETVFSPPSNVLLAMRMSRGAVKMLAQQIVIGFGIAFVFPPLVFYGVSTFCPAPQRRDFFGNLPPSSAKATPEEREPREDRVREQQRQV